jgi:hypothetical protein
MFRILFFSSNITIRRTARLPLSPGKKVESGRRARLGVSLSL